MNAEQQKAAERVEQAKHQAWQLRVDLLAAERRLKRAEAKLRKVIRAAPADWQQIAVVG